MNKRSRLVPSLLRAMMFPRGLSPATLPLRLAWGLLLVVGLLGNTHAQELSPEELDAYKEECRDLISFLQFTLNTIGDPATSVRDKDVILNESYLKMFRDAEVQVEDDLEEARRVVTNKDVQAYLKDVDFFFKQAQFEFTIEDITHEVNEDGQIYFLIALSRNLQAITIKGDSLNLTQPRFVEVNLDPEQKDLKIASIYTTKLSEEEELAYWWNELSGEWQQLLGEDIALNDSVNMARLLRIQPNISIGDTVFFQQVDTLVISDSTKVLDMLMLSDTLSLGDTLFYRRTDTVMTNNPIVFAHLKRLVDSKSLNLSNHMELTDLSPLSKFSQLQELDISFTGASSLVPLRNLTKLRVLRCNNTTVSDLSPLRYALELRELYCQQTLIRELAPIQNFSKLEKLYCYQTYIDELDELASLKNLRELLCFRTNISSLDPLAGATNLSLLKCSQTYITSLSPLSNATKLEVLDIESNFISDLSALSGLNNLRLLFCDSTQVLSLEPLRDLPNLKKVYCDNTSITRQLANQFMRARPEVLVVYGSAQLSEWWQNLNPAWQQVFGGYVQVSARPTREELHEIANLEEIDIFGHPTIGQLTPLSMLINLKTLIVSQTRVSDLQPLRDLVDLQRLECINTPVADLSPLQQLYNLHHLQLAQTQVMDLSPLARLGSLEVLNVDKTQVADLSPLNDLSKLKKIYSDHTQVNRTQVVDFSLAHPDVLVVYQSPALQQWWEGLTDEWRQIFRRHVTTSELPSREQLHEMMRLTKLELPNGSRVRSLASIEGLFRLQELSFSDTQIGSLEPLRNMKTLERLHCAKNPITSLEPLSGLFKLRYLNCENTPVEDLDPLVSLINLEDLRCGGTQVDDLEPLAGLYKLKRLDVYNTDVKRLKDIYTLPNLLRLTCYNTRINDRRVEKFQKMHPDTEIVYY